MFSCLQLVLPGLLGASEGQALSGTVITDPTDQWMVGDLSAKTRQSCSEAA